MQQRLWRQRTSPTYLCLTIKEKLERVHSIADGAAYDGEPMENDGWFIWVFEEQLLKNGAQNDKHQQGGESSSSGQNMIRYYGWEKAHCEGWLRAFCPCRFLKTQTADAEVK